MVEINIYFFFRDNVKKPRISALNPVLDDLDKENNKRSRSTRKRKKRPSEASSTESSSSGGENGGPDMLLHEGNNNKVLSGTVFNQELPGGIAPGIPGRTIVPTESQDHVVEVDHTDIAENPTHLALVLKRQKLDPNGYEMPPEETYAFVDLKYFMPISANKYIFKGSCADESADAASFCTPVSGSQGADILDNPQVQQYAQMPSLHADPPTQDYPHLYPHSAGDSLPTNSHCQAGGYIDHTGYPSHHDPSGSYYTPSGNPDHLQYQPNTIVIPPDSIVAPCSAVSPSLTLSSHQQINQMSNTTVTNLQASQNAQ